MEKTLMDNLAIDNLAIDNLAIDNLAIDNHTYCFTFSDRFLEEIVEILGENTEFRHFLRDNIKETGPINGMKCRHVYGHDPRNNHNSVITHVLKHICKFRYMWKNLPIEMQETIMSFDLEGHILDTGLWQNDLLKIKSDEMVVADILTDLDHFNRINMPQQSNRLPSINELFGPIVGFKNCKGQWVAPYSIRNRHIILN